jgi:hypothetical protein
MAQFEHNAAEFVRLRDEVQTLQIEVARLQEKESAAAAALIIANEALKHTQAVQNEWRKENIDQRALFSTIARTEGMFSTEAADRRALEGRVAVVEKASVSDAGKHEAFSTVWANAAKWVALILSGSWLITHFFGK